MNDLDVLVAFKLLSLDLQRGATAKGALPSFPVAPETMAVELSWLLQLPVSELESSLERLLRSGLISMSSRFGLRIHRSAMSGIACHALRYFFPVKPCYRRIGLGMPTAHSGPALSKRLYSAGDHPAIWICEEGQVEGYSIDPIHPLAPKAAVADPIFHALLSIVDSLRVGGARERGVATQVMLEMLDGNHLSN